MEVGVGRSMCGAACAAVREKEGWTLKNGGCDLWGRKWVMGRESGRGLVLRRRERNKILGWEREKMVREKKNGGGAAGKKMAGGLEYKMLGLHKNV